jgi:hypothetical protein
MRPVAERPISEHEARVLELALRRGAVTPISKLIFADVSSFRVVGECACGCRSIYFARESRKDQRLADTWGRTAGGIQIDVMVWRADGRVTIHLDQERSRYLEKVIPANRQFQTE